MKTLLLASFLAGASLYAGESCIQRQKTAALEAYASRLKVPVSSVKVLHFSPGIWTESVVNSAGSDFVTVAVNRMRGVTYRVSAKQIGSTADCVVTGVTERAE